MTAENKLWWQSKTSWGTVVTLVALVAPKVVDALGGGGADGTAADTMAQIAQAVAVLVGVAMTIIGRVKAQGPLAK